MRPPPRATLFPYTTLFRSLRATDAAANSATTPTRSITLGTAPPPPPPTSAPTVSLTSPAEGAQIKRGAAIQVRAPAADTDRSEEHTSELQSQSNLVCRLLL